MKVPPQSKVDMGKQRAFRAGFDAATKALAEDGLQGVAAVLLAQIVRHLEQSAKGRATLTVTFDLDLGDTEKEAGA